MKLVLHTFKKDVRRLWPAVVVSLALLAMLASADRWRFDTMVGAAEGWLNLVLPLAWACLIAFAVLEEPLAGDRHFWLTRPHRWPALLAAKFIFTLFFVHLPSLIADAYILAAHGFSPFMALPQLVWKQLALAAFLTLPAMALSALIRSFTQFMMWVFALAAATVFTYVNATSRHPYTTVRPDDFLRVDLAAFLLATGAIAILWFQYRRRRAFIGRTVAIATVVLAGALAGLVPASAGSRARALLHPIRTPLALRMAPPSAWRPAFVTGSAIIPTFGLPVILIGLPAGSGLPGGVEYSVSGFTVTVVAPDGVRYRNTTFSLDNQFEKLRLDGILVPFPDSYPVWGAKTEPGLFLLTLRFSPALWATVKDRNVRLIGQTVVTLTRPGETTWMPVGSRVAAPGVGHCSSRIDEDQWSRPMVKVLCESPSRIPPMVRVTLWRPDERLSIHRWLENSGNNPAGPLMAWLSPLDRDRTFFNISDPKDRQYRSSWEVPLDQLPDARIAVTPAVVTGLAVVDFDIPDVPLSKYWVEPRR